MKTERKSACSQRHSLFPSRRALIAARLCGVCRHWSVYDGCGLTGEERYSHSLGCNQWSEKGDKETCRTQSISKTATKAG